MYKLETHLHVAGTSPCAMTDEKTIARIYKDKGYNGIVYTSHFNSYMPVYFGFTEKEYNGNFVAHYLNLKEECAKFGIDVFFGMEYMPDCVSYFNDKSPDKAEFLIYGASTNFVESGEAFSALTLSVKDVSELCKRNGWIFSQAHPFRAMINYRHPELIEAAEAYNGCPRCDSRNADAEKYVADNGLIPMAGSDFHEPQDGGAGVMLENAVGNETELVRELRRRRHTLIKN